MPDRYENIPLKRAQSGDEVALAALVATYMPLIRRVARAAAGPGFDFDDAVQEGYIGLFQAVRTYQEDRKASFATYATVCVRNAIVAARRAAGRKKHQALTGAQPLEDQVTAPGPEELAILREQVHEAVHDINTRLSSFEKQALLLSLRGQSYTEIAAKLSKTPKAVDNALVRVRRKLKGTP